MNNQKYRNRTWLYEKYIDENLTQENIANLCDSTRTTIKRWLNKFKIPLKNKEVYIEDLRYRNENWLKYQYIDLGKTSKEIGNILNVSDTTILNWLRNFKIDIRNRGDYDKEDNRYKNKEWLYKQHVILMRKPKDIGIICNTCSRTIIKYLKKYKIYHKRLGKWKPKKKRSKKSGGYYLKFRPEHPNSTKEGYIQEHVLNIEDHLGRYLNEGELVHHIDGNKSNNNITNLVLAKNRSNHNKMHNSLIKCAYELYKKGIISFDREVKRYIIKERVKNSKKIKQKCTDLEAVAIIKYLKANEIEV